MLYSPGRGIWIPPRPSLWPAISYDCTRLTLTGAGGSGANPSPAITAPTAFWRMEEAAGDNRVDTVGAIALSPTNNPSQATGKIGNAAGFASASSQQLGCSDNATLSTGDIDFMFAGWIYFDSTSDWMGIFGKDASGVLEYTLFADNSAPNRQLDFYVKTFSNHVVATNYGAIQLTTWIFVVCWHDSVNNLLGIQVNNGTANTTAYSGGATDTAYGFSVGNTGSGASRYMNGRVDALGFWKNTLLTADEKTLLYNSGSGLEYYSGAWH